MNLQEYIKSRKLFFTRRTSADYKLTGDDILRGKPLEEKKSISTLTQAELFTRHLKMFKHVDPKSKKDFHYPILDTKLKSRDGLIFSPVVYKVKKTENINKSISTLSIQDIKKKHTNKKDIITTQVNVPNANIRTEYISIREAMRINQLKKMS